MTSNHSSLLNGLLKKPVKTITHILFLVLLVALLILGISNFVTNVFKVKYMEGNIEKFDHASKQGEHQQIQPLYLYEYFAETYDDSVNFCIVADDEEFYIVAISVEDMGEYEELIKYTYYETDVEPDPITMTGMSVRLSDEILEYAIEDYNYLAQKEVASDSNANHIFGSSYLDTTKEPSIDYTILVISVVFFALAAWIYSQIIKKGKRSMVVTEETLGKYSAISLAEVDKELINPENTNYSKEKIYFTKNYLVSSNGGLKILKWDDIVHVYGNINNNFPVTKYSIIVKNIYNKEYEIYNTYSKGKARSLNSKIVQHINDYLPDIKYGFEDDFYSYTSSPFYEVNLEENTEVGLSNYMLGILGAILFASIGGIGWVAIASVGFISGLAGAVILNFSLFGYQKLAGGINRKGKIFALLVTIIMIFVANYMIYVMDLSKLFFGTAYSITNIAKSIPKVPGYISYNNLWRDFGINLVIGYGLSFWVAVSSGLIRDIFNKDK